MNQSLSVLVAAIAFSAVSAEGLTEDQPAQEMSSVTFNKDIAPLIFKQCAECHHAGEVAPFPLLTYADVKKHAKQLLTVTSNHFMPPWKSVAGHGTFVGERRLTVDEIERISRWVKEGAPEGRPEDLPPLPRFSEGWKLGKPDIVVTMPAPYEIPAEGPDVYRNFVFGLPIPKGKYIKAAEYHPSNRRVVHHALLAEDVTGRARKQQTDPATGFKGGLNIPGQLFPGSMATWTPGRDPAPLGDGLSMPWKEGSDLVLQLHLHPSGKPEEEQSSIGFYLTDQPPQRSMADLLMIDKKIDIPPDEPAFRTRDEVTLPIDVEVLGVFPHMHLLGRDIRITAYPPQGEPLPLIWIDDWDFNWQTFYQYATPVKLAAGTRIVLEGIHDNSAGNIHNPSKPPKRVVWGEQTTNEMTVAFLQLMPVREEDMPKLAGPLRGRILGTITASANKPGPP